VVVILLAVAVPGVVVGMSGSASLHFRTGKGLDEGEKPNFVVIQTDDQTYEQLAAMPKLNELVAEEGTSYSRYYASFPLCCPSRATLLTGMYAHNTGVLGNQLPEGGYQLFRQGEALPVWLQREGYTTGHVGKFLNRYGQDNPREIPLGWDEWVASPFPHQHDFTNYRLNVNGELVRRGSAESDHVDDVYTEAALDFLRRHAEEEDPFFLALDYLAPHEATGTPAGRCGHSAIPAPRHLGAFADLPLPENPALDEADVGDKPEFVRERSNLTPDQLALLTTAYQCRRESLLAVDEGIAKIVELLEDAGELDRTFVVFVSDNGYLQGEHRFWYGKRRAYDVVAHVPFLIRGPGVERGRVRDNPVANIDIAPTLLDAAGALDQVPDRFVLDGRSLLPQLRGAGPADPAVGPERAILVEIPRGYRVAPAYAGVRTQRYSYVEYVTGERELYDLQRDPYELDSRHADPAYIGVQAALQNALAALRACAGRACDQVVAVPEPMLLAPLAKPQLP
jgi:N-acetylglucosamine-6-sulfatase